MKWPLLCMALGLVAWAGGCGYHFPNRSAALPPEARTIAIRVFHNRTQTIGLEAMLHQALEDEFRRHGQLRVVDADGPSDLVLVGTLRSLESVPVGFSSTDQAIQYSSALTLDVRLLRTGQRRPLWEVRRLREAQDFAAVPGVVITSAPDFQRGTLDGRDLRGLTNVQVAETRRQEAVRLLVEQTAREIYTQLMEAF